MSSQSKPNPSDRFAPLENAPDLGPLQRAARAGNTERVRALLDEGHEVNEAGEDGDTALHWAAAWGKEDVIGLLLERGADPTLRDYDDNTPLHLISKKGYTSVHSFMRLLAKACGLVNEPNGKGATPLHAAALRGRADFVKLLLEAGADPSQKDGEGRTPLELAERARRANVVELLSGAGPG